VVVGRKERIERDKEDKEGKADALIPRTFNHHNAEVSSPSVLLQKNQAVEQNMGQGVI
jgi:hypothetical protein